MNELLQRYAGFRLTAEDLALLEAAGIKPIAGGADTLSANIAESTQEIIATTQALMPQKAPMINLVTRVDIPKGKNAAELPYVNSTSSVQTITEGDEVVQTSQFDLASVTISPTIRAIKVRVAQRAERFSKEALIELITDEMSQTEAQNVDELLLALLPTFNTANDVGTTNTDLTFAVLRRARRLLNANTRANGGPAPAPISCVLGPVGHEDLLTNLGAQGVVASNPPWIPSGISEEIMRMYGIPGGALLGGVAIMWDGYVTEDGSADEVTGMFAKKALAYASSKEWELKTFEESNWIGKILRADSDFGVGLSGRGSRWGAQITADGA